MDIAYARDKLAAAASSHETDGRPISGYREPPGSPILPAFVVLDPDTIEYHDTYAGGLAVIVPARIIVPFAAGEPARALDTLLSPDGLPATLEAFDSNAAWEQAVVLRKRPGPYLEFAPGPKREPIGLAADIEIRLTPTDQEPEPDPPEEEPEP